MYNLNQGTAARHMATTHTTVSVNRLSTTMYRLYVPRFLGICTFSRNLHFLKKAQRFLGIPKKRGLSGESAALSPESAVTEIE